MRFLWRHVHDSAAGFVLFPKTRPLFRILLLVRSYISVVITSMIRIFFVIFIVYLWYAICYIQYVWKRLKLFQLQRAWNADLTLAVSPEMTFLRTEQELLFVDSWDNPPVLCTNLGCTKIQSTDSKDNHTPRIQPAIGTHHQSASHISRLPAHPIQPVLHLIEIASIDGGPCPQKRGKRQSCPMPCCSELKRSLFGGGCTETSEFCPKKSGAK